MDFDKSRCYSAINADELRAGDKVIVSDTMSTLTLLVRETTDSMELATLKKVRLDNEVARFETSTGNWCLAYLVERAENCTNCGCVHCWYREKHKIDEQRLHTCSKRKVEKQYRPFRDVDELIKVWEKKWSDKTNGQKWHDCKLNMPHIWVQTKNAYKAKLLITEYEQGRNLVTVDNDDCDMEDLFKYFEFLDGSPCGVEE